MTTKQKLLKIIFFSAIIALLLATCISCIVQYDEKREYSYGEYISKNTYGADAYTDIQNGIADIGNNVDDAGYSVFSVASDMLDAILLMGIFSSLITMLVFAYLLLSACLTPAIDKKPKPVTVAPQINYGYNAMPQNNGYAPTQNNFYNAAPQNDIQTQ